MFKHILVALVALLLAAPAFAQGGYVTQEGRIVAKSATGSLTASEVSGTIITNTGASGAIVLTLPDCSADTVGMHALVVLTVAQDVDLNPADAVDQIVLATNAAGDALSSAAAIGNGIEIRCVAADVWYSSSPEGTWTDVN